MNESRQQCRQNDYAFFFDIDGTLASLQATPEAVSIPVSVITDLKQLTQQLGGAVAFVSGRPLSQIDALTQPLRGAAAGIHGAEIRAFNGELTTTDTDAQQLGEIEQQLSREIASLPGVRLEKKGIAFALHYRQVPSAQQVLQRLADDIVKRYPDFKVQAGKCVWEIKPRACDKGKAIDFLMQTPPFKGRIPVFLGDDVTDEAGFQSVNRQQGISIKIGSGESEATQRINDVTALYQWLGKLANNNVNLDNMRSV
ncbi:trehalose-phosphatase [Tatumella sp. OPLPL6]|uniref:trehalose-phosphatase n=1 Tax=Tatumella sp. OPLPL6 TaxID=1928657 RepID=UPI000C194063|nr:trehalose-phosphatase [Tatumella sp. OPLPL6]PIJ46170.1 trehalose-phosphatase [Tatumella sp. OPLPL6]